MGSTEHDEHYAEMAMGSAYILTLTIATPQNTSASCLPHEL